MRLCSTVASLGVAFASSLLAASGSAQTEAMVFTGDILPGLGVVDAIHEVAVNDAGDWIVSVHTDQMSSSQLAFVANGTVVLKPGDAIPGFQPGFTFDAGRSLEMDAAGNWTWTAAHPNLALNYGSGAYQDKSLYATVGGLVDAPGVTVGTTYKGIYDQVVESGGTLIVHGIMTDPVILGFQQNLLTRMVPQAGGGFVSTALVKRGDLLPGVASPVQSLSEYRHGLAANASGQVLYLPAFQSGPQTGVYLNQTPLALAGQQSPVFGRVWSSFMRMPVALNQVGDFAYAGRLSGDVASDQLIVWNGIKLVQEGEPLASVAPHMLTSFGIGGSFPSPLELADDGRIFWFGEWSDPDDTRNSGLFVDHTLLFQEGVSALGGLVIDDFQAGAGAPPVATFDVSPDGATIALRVLLADGRTGAFLVRPAGAVETIQACVPNLGSMTASGVLKVGSAGAFNLNGAQSLGASGFVFISTGPLGPCGLALPGIGEVLIDIVPPNPILTLAGLFPGVPQTIALLPQLPNDPVLFGFTLYAQGLWVDTTGAPGVELFRLTNALGLSIGL